eukprot:1159942-Pelagomonas_calceolata.AAC.14
MSGRCPPLGEKPTKQVALLFREVLSEQRKGLLTYPCVVNKFSLSNCGTQHPTHHTHTHLDRGKKYMELLLNPMSLALGFMTISSLHKFTNTIFCKHQPIQGYF